MTQCANISKLWSKKGANLIKSEQLLNKIGLSFFMSQVSELAGKNPLWREGKLTIEGRYSLPFRQNLQGNSKATPKRDSIVSSNDWTTFLPICGGSILLIDILDSFGRKKSHPSRRKNLSRKLCPRPTAGLGHLVKTHQHLPSPKKSVRGQDKAYDLMILGGKRATFSEVNDKLPLHLLFDCCL